jgi:hypothetical protein
MYFHSTVRHGAHVVTESAYRTQVGRAAAKAWPIAGVPAARQSTASLISISYFLRSNLGESPVEVL